MENEPKMESLEGLEKKMFEDVNVLVTGAGGFVGTWLAKSLADKGANVITFDKNINPKSNFYLLGLDKKTKVILGDIVKYSFVKDVIDKNEINIVFHLAAKAIVGEAAESPLPTFEINILGTTNALDICRNSKTVEKVIVASSDKAYGSYPVEKLPYREDFPLKASNPYDVSKACADLISQVYFKAYGLPVAITRCSNIYGGGDFNWSRIIPGTIKSVLEDEAPIIRSDGSPIREYIYIDDAVNAYLTLAEKLEKVKGEAFNFGSGEKISALDLVNKIIQISGKSHLKPKVLGTAKGEIDVQYLSSEKAKKLLGWEAKVSLEEGLKNTVEWYKQNEKSWK